MASITFSVSPLEGSSWGGIIDLGVANELTSIVSATKPENITPTGGVMFSTIFGQVFNFYGGGANGSYFTIRQTTVFAPQVYPTSGYSIDIWSENLTNAIAGGATWQNLIDGGLYNLSTTKFSLVYDYSGLNAPYWSKGGTIDFT
jgi:hypothetical protein